MAAARTLPPSHGRTSVRSLSTRGRRQLLVAIYDGKPFRDVLRNLGLTSNQVCGLTKTRQGMVDRAGDSINRYPPGRPQAKARYQRRVRGGLRMRRLPGAPAAADGQEGWAVAGQRLM